MLPNDFGILLRDHNAYPGPRGASRVAGDPVRYRANSNSLLERTFVGTPTAASNEPCPAGAQRPREGSSTRHPV